VLRRLAQAVVITVLVVVLPVLGNAEMLRSVKMWMLVAFGVLASVLQPGYNPFTMMCKRDDRGSGSQIIWSVYVTQVAAVLEGAYLRYPQSVRWGLVATLALGTMAAGLALRTWAVLTLGDLFTMHLSVQREHAIIRDGPYRFVRHPSYLGAFVMYVSTALFLHAWLAALAAVALLPFAFLRRIRHEEEMLSGAFGDDYESYRSEVRKILPGIW